MARTTDELRAIFDRTDGDCHICGEGLCFSNYGQLGRRGAWEIEHSNPKCNGGTDRLNNCYAAHITCNREKGTKSTRAARGWNGRTRAPLSKQRKDALRSENAWGLGALGGLIGAALGGPAGFIVGGLAGALLGNGINPE